MNPQSLAGMVALAAIVLYAIFGGADYGGGVWDLLARGPRRNAQRKAIGLAMGPVWETNHIWLIFAMVTMFTCFPPVFAKISVALYVPLTFALVGIIMRGAAFAFRGPSTRELLVHKVWGHVFGVASLLTPFLFGAAAGGVATGTFDWLAPFSICIGFFAVALCAQVAAAFLYAETRGELQSDFRTRAIITTLVVAATGLAALVAAASSNAGMFNRLLAAWPFIACAMAAGMAALTLLWTRRFAVARFAVVIEVVGILSGWYVAEGPVRYINLGLHDLSAPAVTIETFLWIAFAGSVVLIPSLLLLFAVFKREPIDA